jgi:hypothetical protein
MVKLFRWVCALILVLSVPGIALAKEKEKPAETKPVDSGSFGVFVKGRRVGTETFSVTQNANGSVIHSEFKAEGAAGQAVLDSELQLTGNGEIRRYEWKEQSPGKAVSVVIPKDQFVTQTWSAGPQDKEHEKPYLLSTSTSILDDYFFVHREVLAWKYLGGACSREKEGLRCPKAQFGTMNPSQYSSAPASMQYLGRNKVKIHDVERELNKLELKSEAEGWILWLDDAFKVLLISIPSEGTEVIRD